MATIDGRSTRRPGAFGGRIELFGAVTVERPRCAEDAAIRLKAYFLLRRRRTVRAE
ncbi:MAG TPA: hypothetical protein VK390_15850 [Propionibacteriaceae bacterium]|nr:hypothetical protein [Propionibacteriaceae bacterium]